MRARRPSRAAAEVSGASKTNSGTSLKSPGSEAKRTESPRFFGLTLVVELRTQKGRKPQNPKRFTWLKEIGRKEVEPSVFLAAFGELKVEQLFLFGTSHTKHLKSIAEKDRNQEQLLFKEAQILDPGGFGSKNYISIFLSIRTAASGWGSTSAYLS